MDSELTYLHRLLEDNRILELRHEVGGRWRSHFVDDAGALVRSVDELSRKGNLYSSINRPAKPVSPRARLSGLGNEDIEVITRLPFDFDPKRPKDTNSTNAELQAAIACRNKFVSTLSAAGWPIPLLGMSGNGAHAVYRTSIKAKPVCRAWFSLLYSGLRQRFADLFAEHNVIFDVSVRNPARVWRVYGTPNRKAPHSAERPQRISSCTLPAGPWQTVKAAQIQRLAEVLRPRVLVNERDVRPFITGTGDYRSLDVVAWFTSHGLYLGQRGDNIHAVRCPWVADHSCDTGLGQTVVFENPGQWPGFYCHHAHCEGRTIRDVMALLGDADSFCRESFRKEGVR